MASSAYHRRHNTMAEKREAYAPKSAHPGFKGAAASIERREGVSDKRADAILAAGAPVPPKRQAPVAKMPKRMGAKKPINYY